MEITAVHKKIIKLVVYAAIKNLMTSIFGLRIADRESPVYVSSSPTQAQDQTGTEGKEGSLP